MREKMILDETIVKYIFTGTHPTVALGEDGYIVYDFDTTYPSKLAVFIPIEVEPSNYSNVFPKSFEDYFKDLDLEISRLSLLVERGNIFDRFPVAEFVAGQILKRDDGKYTVFRFDELVEPEQRTELLCRTKIKGISASGLNKIYAVSEESFTPERAQMIDTTEYIYWFLPLRKLFCQYDETLESLIPMMMESLCR